MESYLYGLNIQSIQELIFETTKLKEIIGASDFVEQICTSQFKEIVGQAEFKDEALIIGAAGRIQYVFDDRASCQEVVLRYPQQIQRLIPGISLAQAVVKIEGELKEEHLKQLDNRLAIQRNKIPMQHGLGLMISERSRRTGVPAVKLDKSGEQPESLDAKQANKRAITDEGRHLLFRKLLGTATYPSQRFPLEIEDLLPGRGNENEWIAVVHADGNSLGKAIQRMAQELNPGDMQRAMKTFSAKLDEATRLSANAAFKEVVEPVVQQENGPIPLRPVLLGGDDLTIIIRGNLALDFTNTFLEKFSIYTKLQFKELEDRFGIKAFQNGLTACAGIVYVKYNYPFHYAVKLADDLCKHAKNVAKKIDPEQVPGGLAFHRVQSSFVDGYSSIIETELTAGIDGNAVRLDYGPYFLEPKAGYTSIKQLKYWARELERKDAPKANLRNWLSTLTQSPAEAQQQMNRIKHIHPKYVSRLELHQAIRSRKHILKPEKSQDYAVTHLFDASVLASMK